MKAVWMEVEVECEYNSCMWDLNNHHVKVWEKRESSIQAQEKRRSRWARSPTKRNAFKSVKGTGLKQQQHSSRGSAPALVGFSLRARSPP